MSLFDEPTWALDLRYQLEDLHQIKRAVVQIHDVILAARFGDHLILVRQSG